MTARLLLTAWLLTVPLPAVAWQQYRTQPDSAVGSQQGCGLRWAESDLGLALDATPLHGIADADLVTALQVSMQAWQDVQCPLCASCTRGQSTTEACPDNPLGQTLHYLGRGTPSPIGATCTSQTPAGTCDKVAGNGNWVDIVQDKATWQEQGVSSLVVALTVLTYDRASGEIRDADILLDDWGHDFCLAPDCPALAYDLQATLTHELGHVLGLDHSTDPEATMYIGADPKETKKRTLETDDRTGICTAYRTTCAACTETVPTPGCQAGRSTGVSAAILLLALAWYRLRRARN